MLNDRCFAEGANPGSSLSSCAERGLSLFRGLETYCLASGPADGCYNMALDEALLEYVRAQQRPMLVVRTYTWREPTLSLGVNQTVRDLDFLLSFYAGTNAAGSDNADSNLAGAGGPPVIALVRRPTGGRAILHGRDISYSFITNEPTLLRQSLKVSYPAFAGLVQLALERLNLPVRFSDQAGDRDYVRSPICFETHTPSDLLAAGGKKLTGSAQLRRVGGILQHGAAFLAPYFDAPNAMSLNTATRTALMAASNDTPPNNTPDSPVPSSDSPSQPSNSPVQASEQAFTEALFATVEQVRGQTLQPFPIASIQSLLVEREAAYRKESGEIRDSASTTRGSHFDPASL